METRDNHMCATHFNFKSNKFMFVIFLGRPRWRYGGSGGVGVGELPIFCRLGAAAVRHGGVVRKLKLRIKNQ